MKILKKWRENIVNYLLKLFDLPLLKFSVVEDLATPVLEILWINEEKRNLLPLDMEPTSDGLANWMCRRAIPKNRAFVHALLAKCNLNLNRPMSIISICKGLSLNDSYWVVEEGFDGTYDKTTPMVLAVSIQTSSRTVRPFCLAKYGLKRYRLAYFFRNIAHPSSDS